MYSILYPFLQVSEESQTCISALGPLNENRLFNKVYRKSLARCCSFFTCNTQADDNTPVYIDMNVQTVESGGLIVEKNMQTECDNTTFEKVFTGIILSLTEMISTSCEIPDSNSELDVESEDVSFSDSYSNTIITFG